MPLAILLLWGGYGLSSWGYILVRGYNITLREWFSPLHPYQWPANGWPAAVPQGQVFPSAPGATSSDPTTAAKPKRKASSPPATLD